jgi:hypothetical protein
LFRHFKLVQAVQKISSSFNTVQHRSTVFDSIQQRSTVFNSVQQRSTAFNGVQRDCSTRLFNTLFNSFLFTHRAIQPFVAGVGAFFQHDLKQAH